MAQKPIYPVEIAPRPIGSLSEYVIGRMNNNPVMVHSVEENGGELKVVLTIYRRSKLEG